MSEVPDSITKAQRYVASHQRYMSVQTMKDMGVILAEVASDVRAALRRAEESASEEAARSCVPCPILDDGMAAVPGGADASSVCEAGAPAVELRLVAVGLGGECAVVGPGGVRLLAEGELRAFSPDTEDRVLADASLPPAEYCRQRGIEAEDPETEKSLDLVMRMSQLRKGEAS